MKTYQILYFFIGMAISLFNTYFFIGYVLGDMPNEIWMHVLAFAFAILLGCTMAYSAKYHREKKRKEEELLKRYNASILKKN